MFCLTKRINNEIFFYQMEETKVEKKNGSLNTVFLLTYAYVLSVF